MSADLIKEKIAQAVEKINSLKEELRSNKAENENLQNSITELHARNLELNDRIQKLEEEKRNIADNNDNTVKEIEDRLAMLNEILELEKPELKTEDVKKEAEQQANQDHFFNK